MYILELIKDAITEAVIDLLTSEDFNYTSFEDTESSDILEVVYLDNGFWVVLEENLPVCISVEAVEIAKYLIEAFDDFLTVYAEQDNRTLRTILETD